MKALDSLLPSLRLQSTLQNRVVLGEPWGVAFPPSKWSAKFHYVETGAAILSVPGHEPVRLEPGDLAIVFADDWHTVQDVSMSPPVDVRRLVDQAEIVCQSGITLSFGAGGPQTSLITGVFRFDEDNLHPLYRALPPFIHLKRQDGASTERIDATLRLLSLESTEVRPGVRTVLDRLCDILFIQSLRGWVQSEDAGGGFPLAVKDPAIDEALDIMQRMPHERWTIERLASRVAMSRSGFAERFRRLLGDPPMDYLHRWRMHLAAEMLLSGSESTARIAEQVGYESEASFAKAFKKTVGVAPGAYRRRLNGAAAEGK